MIVVVTPEVQAQIDHYFHYGVEWFGVQTAQRTLERIERFLATLIADHPKPGTYLPKRGIYETWIPKTPFVILYRVIEANQTLRVVGFFYGSQSRAGFDPDAGDLP
jgi:plasmid stabilization system protein ParE